MNAMPIDHDPAPKPFATLVKRILRLLVICYICILTVLGFFQRKLLYRPTTSDAMPVAAFPDATGGFTRCEDVEIPCANGESVRGWLLRQQVQKPTGRSLVIYFHGNARNRSTRGPWYDILREADLEVLAIDYQGYGDSGGSATESTIELSCEAAWSFATNRLGYHPDEISIAGTSLGGAAAVYLTDRQCRAGVPPACLFVTATFSSMVDVASSLYRWLPVRSLLVDTFPSDQRAPNVTCPVLVLHGDVDALVDQRFGRRLFDAFPKESDSGVPKQWVSLTDVGHHNIVKNGGRTILNEIRALFQRVRVAKAEQSERPAEAPSSMEESTSE